MREVYISVDVETTGPIPGTFSMYQLGACVVGDKRQNFFARLKLLNENCEDESLVACRVTLPELLAKGEDPAVVMRRFATWVLQVSAGARPVFVAFNATFDWMFVHWYFCQFLGHSPFGHNGLDVKAYYMGLTGCEWGDTSKGDIVRRFPPRYAHTHNALDDAIEQAQIFEQMLAVSR
ncbi:MAG: exonuclease domain-containing protein [Patescibacteria group bacterium]|jgi:DNA polymerase III alpha subunit (gram-positive type)